MKVCTKCKIEKPFLEFCKDKRRKHDIGSHCKKCNYVVSERCRKNNPIKYKKYSLDSYYRHIEKKRILAREYKKNNPEKIRKSLKEWRLENKERIQKYYENNKDWFKALNAQRRIRISKYKGNPQKIKEFYTEAIRLTELTGIEHHVDHIVPLTSKYVCGLHYENNLQVIPFYENLAKSNKFIPYST